MPLYEYNCQKCHQNHEVMQKLADPPLKKCPKCGGKLVKALSATAFQLRGGGWYKDGYSTPATGKKEEKPAPSTTPAPAKDTGSGGKKKE